MQRPGRCAWSSAQGLSPVLSAFDALTSVSCRAIEIMLLTTLTLISRSLSLTLPDLEAFLALVPSRTFRPTTKRAMNVVKGLHAKHAYLRFSRPPSNRILGVVRGILRVERENSLALRFKAPNNTFFSPSFFGVNRASYLYRVRASGMQIPAMKCQIHYRTHVAWVWWPLGMVPCA